MMHQSVKSSTTSLSSSANPQLEKEDDNVSRTRATSESRKIQSQQTRVHNTHVTQQLRTQLTKTNSAVIENCALQNTV